MTGSVLPEGRLRTARILHGSLIAAVGLFLLVTTWVHKTTPPLLGPNSGGVFTIIGLVVLGAALVALRLLPAPDATPALEQAVAQWAGTLGRMIVRWAAVEAASLANAVMWFLTRDRVSLGGALAGLIVLVLLRPGRDLE